MPFCIHCGTQNPEVAKFCSNCGQPISKQPEPGISNSEPPVSTASNIQIDQSSSSIGTAADKGSSNPVTSTPPPSRSVTPDQPAPTSQFTDNPFFASPAFWGALLVLLGFFLPWIPNNSYFMDGGSLNGSGFAKTFSGLIARDGDDMYEIAGIFFAVILYLMPVASAYIIYDVLFNKNIGKLSKIIRFIPVSVFLILVILVCIALANGQGKVDFSRFKIGIIMSLVGAVSMIYLKRK